MLGRETAKVGVQGLFIGGWIRYVSYKKARKTHNGPSSDLGSRRMPSWRMHCSTAIIDLTVHR
jgi:hypothetical protein